MLLFVASASNPSSFFSQAGAVAIAPPSTTGGSSTSSCSAPLPSSSLLHLLDREAQASVKSSLDVRDQVRDQVRRSCLEAADQR